jgi:protein-S-isoprenylcysteine O-methyltransferase Ste14
VGGDASRMLLLKNLLFTFLVPGTVAGWLPWVIAGHRPLASGPTLGVALALFAVGGSIYAWCVWDFATFGRGTPAPIDAPKRLVVRGLYRFTRNPMYVGVLTVILGWAALFEAPLVGLYALVVATVFHGFVRLYEEPQLERLFGAEYRDYKSRVGRWLPQGGRDGTPGD